MEEWADQFMDLLREGEVVGQGKLQTGSHKSQLFFLRHMLRQESLAADPDEAGDGLKETLLAKLRSIAGLALGGNAIFRRSNGQVSLRKVQPHRIQAGSGPTRSSHRQFPRSLLPVVGARNPFCELLHFLLHLRRWACFYFL